MNAKALSCSPLLNVFLWTIQINYKSGVNHLVAYILHSKYNDPPLAVSLVKVINGSLTLHDKKGRVNYSLSASVKLLNL